MPLAPSWVANSAYDSGTNSITMSFPSGYAANDILVLSILGHNVGIPAQNQTNLTNNGWARVANSNTVINGATTANVFLDIWWQRASTASQTAVVLGDAGDHTLSVCAAFRDCFPFAAPWDGLTLNVSNTSAVSQVTSYNTTTSFANSLVVTIIAGPRDSAAAHLNASPVLINGAAGDTELTERCDWGTASGTGSTLAILTHRCAGLGATANVRANTLTSQTAITWTGALRGEVPISFGVVV